MYSGLSQLATDYFLPHAGIETPYSFRPAPTDATLISMRVWYSTNPPSWLHNTRDQAFFAAIYGPKALQIALRFGKLPENIDPNFSYDNLDQSQWDLFADDGTIVHSGTDWWLMDLETIAAEQWRGGFTPTAGGILPNITVKPYVSQADIDYEEFLLKQIEDRKRREEEAAEAARLAALAAAEALRLKSLGGGSDAAAEAARLRSLAATAAEAARLAALAAEAAAEALKLKNLGDLAAAAAAAAEAARLKAAADAAAAATAGAGGGGTIALAIAAYWIFFA